MPKRPLSEQVDEAVQAMLVSLQPHPEKKPHANLAALTAIARELRLLPREEFRTTLKSNLQRRTPMNEAVGVSRAEESAKFRRPNFPNIAPYFLVKDAPKFIDFLVAAFAGTERIRVPRPDGTIMHGEVAIGNSVIEMGDANEQYPARTMTTHLYVPDADATYAQALQAGAAGVYAPTDEHPSGDRWGEASDPFGNTWYIATRRGKVSGPEGFLTVQPYLHVSHAHELIPFVEAAFGARTTGLHKSPDGLVRHATIEIAGATFEVDEADGGVAATESYLHVYVPDTDAAYERALRAGATGVNAPYTAPYRDRAATVSDRFGNMWFIATYLGGDVE